MGTRMEKLLAGVMLAGFGAIALGMLLLVLVLMRLPVLAARLAFGPFLILGTLAVLASVVIGRIHAQGGLRRGEPVAVPSCRVVARYGIDELGEMRFDEFDTHPGIKFYVRLWFPDGTQNEFLCARETYDECAEGMWGAAKLQGDWLGNFVPTVGPGTVPTGNPYL